jgi:predicted RNase H-like HicB family nuclease
MIGDLTQKGQSLRCRVAGGVDATSRPRSVRPLISKDGAAAITGFREKARETTEIERFGRPSTSQAPLASDRLIVDLRPYVVRYPMEALYTAVIQQDGDWWIGWVEEVPGVNSQGSTREELLDNLRDALDEALEMNRQDARSAATGAFEEVRLVP